MLATWGTSTGLNPTLDLQFAGATSLDSRITFTRGSTATYFDSTGTLQTAAINAARFDTNPATLAPLGLLIEEQRTNSIRNNTMQGAVAGTPGTLPTNWVTTLRGLTQTVVGTGTQNGITYIDLRFNGTTTSSGAIEIKPDGNAGVIAATASQAWAMSSWVAIVGGSTANTTGQRFIVNEYSAGPTYLRTAVAATNVLAGGATLTRVSGAITTGASTTIVEPMIILDVASGVAIDITLRIGLPQLEQGAFATSVIPTTTTALTRNADVASMTGTNFSAWYNQSAGTFLTVYSLARPSSGSNQFTVRASDNSYNNSVAMNTDATGFAAIATASGGVFDGVASAALALTANVTARVAGCYATNDLALSFNGAAVVTDTSATIPTGMTRLDIGSDHAGLNRIQGGYIQRIAYYPRRLPNSTLQALTA